MTNLKVDQNIGALPVAEQNRTALALKRILDLVLAAALLVAVSPFLAVMALLVKFDSPGPVFYRRRVVGLGGEVFDAFKVRTMIVNADEFLRQYPDLWTEYQKNIKLKHDPRVTRVGRWLRRLSLDELPQFFNVLRGEMSIVGPRMVTPEELLRYGEFANKRVSVKPGITGLWQVSGRQDVSYEERIRLDMSYLDHWSLWLDLKIMLKTIPAVLGMTGAY